MKLWKLFRRRVRMPVRDPEWKARKLEKLKLRIRALPDDDSLIPLLLQLLDEFAVNEIEAGVAPQVGDEEAHRFRGRLGMAMEFRRELEELWLQSRRQLEEGKSQ